VEVGDEAVEEAGLILLVEAERTHEHEQASRRLRATRVPAVTSLPGFCSTSNSIHSPR
jgi:hypothetical protein